MLHVLAYSPDWRSDPVLCSMFSARKRVFIDLLKWDLPVCDNAYELDRFDEPGAVYLIVSAADGSHRASARLLPTTRPHLLSAIFPDLCADAPPTGATVREITRFCLERNLRAQDRRRARNELITALADYGHVHELSAYTGVAELAWFEQICAFGWDCRALGRPRQQDGQQLTGLQIDLKPDTRERLAATGIYTRTLKPVEVRHAA